MSLFLASLLITSSLLDTTQTLYAQKDVEALRRVCAAPENREADLLCRYRLYPLTQQAHYLDALPDDLPASASPRDLALLSGLWGYKTARAPLHLVPRYGLRAERLLRRAREQAPEDPFVLLIDGQSLLFKPAIAGGDRRAALQRFQALRGVAARHPAGGVSVLEAELWTWYALERLGDASADGLRARLLAQQPPLLYREFLLSPP